MIFYIPQVHDLFSGGSSIVHLQCQVNRLSYRQGSLTSHLPDHDRTLQYLAPDLLYNKKISPVDQLNIMSQQRQPPPQTQFFLLTPEVRDKVYSYAFGNEAYHFNYRGLNFIAITTFEADTNPRPGLPQWLLTSRTICSEAVETLIHTRTFGPRYRSKISVSNSLILHVGAIRTMTLSNFYRYASKACPRLLAVPDTVLCGEVLRCIALSRRTAERWFEVQRYRASAKEYEYTDLESGGQTDKSSA